MTNKIILSTLATCAVLLGMTACKTNRNAVAANDVNDVVAAPAPVALGTGVRRMPRAILYRTNVNVKANVAVTLNPATNTLTYYPDPYDVAESTEPLVMADGWLLDRQGAISPDTRFLKWTMAEYHTFAKVPTVDNIMAAVIPDAHVTAIVRLDMTPMAAQSDTAIVNKQIRNGLSDAQWLLR